MSIPQVAKQDRYPLPIYLFLVGLLAVVSAGAVRAAPSLQGLFPAVGLGALLAVHLFLHWYSPRAAGHARSWIQYALAQGGLAVALTLATGNPSLWAAAFTWLLGEAVGLLARPVLTAGSLVWYGLLGVAALFAATDAATAFSWLSATLPTALFIGLVVVLYKRQVEAREEANRLVEELALANRQISAYAVRVEALTLSNERQRMARELHDTLAQDVAGLVLQLEAANAHLDAGRGAKAQAIVQQAMSRARSTLRTARAAIDDLRVREARDRLSDRLAALCQRFEVDSGLQCAIQVEAGAWEGALSTAQKEHIERIVSEALANVRQHARATRVTIEVGTTRTNLTVQVRDDGTGFAADDVPRAGHYGLRGLRERAALLDGSVEVQSAPQAGTTVLLTMPFPEGALLEESSP